MSERKGIAKIKPQYLLLTEKKESSSETTDLEENKAKYGKKKDNRINFLKNDSKMCNMFLKTNGHCDRGESCKFSHDLDSYLASKPKNFEELCVNFEKDQQCPYGVTCRYSHNSAPSIISNGNSEEGKKSCGVQEETCASLSKTTTLNTVSFDTLMQLRKKKYQFPKSDAFLKNLALVKSGGKFEEVFNQALEENNSLNFSLRNKLYLAPLTTVGNLPFRRICKQFGADITCSEMVVATSLLQGKQSEWALLKRHSTEDIFGVQVVGSFPDTLAKAVEMISDTVKVDFIDLNMGCPIDIMYTKGAGCALMPHTNKIKHIVRGMREVSNVPITIKMRTGLHDNHNICHKIIPDLEELGVSAITIHGRSREQRYSKLADWNYIKECGELAKKLEVIGNGDILSYEDYCERKTDNLSTCMIGRGALIKPWIFTEIKEQRIWDISSNERFDMLKSYTKCGLEHWGTDTQGVEKTRNFLLEWLSFLCRYIPVGILEHPPQKINQRPPPYQGRDELETLFASPEVSDWIKISSMLLGPVPENFKFLPKHKSNAYG